MSCNVHYNMEILCAVMLLLNKRTVIVCLFIEEKVESNTKCIY